jgi:hypothetical protein
MAFALKGGHPLERDPVAKGDVRRRHVDPQLHSERPPEGQLALELALGLNVYGVAREVV